MNNLSDPAMIERLARLLTEGGLTELELQDDKARLRLVRLATATVQLAAVTPPSASHVPPHSPSAAPAEPPPPEGAVKSPMVGIAYLAPEPGAAPYVTLGQPVTAGQTLMLIEAMKTFNQIKAPRAGTITQILVQAGSPVEYDQPLMVIA